MVIGKELVAIREEQYLLIKTILNLIGNVNPPHGNTEQKPYG
jgi:hypothetical protein